MKIITSSNVTKKDIFNMMANSVSFKAVLNQPIKVKGCAVVEISNNDGGVDTVSYIVDNEGIIYGGNSTVIVKLMDSVVSILEDGEEITVTPVSFKSASNRDCITLKML